VGQGALVGVIAGAVFGFLLPELWLSDMTKARNLRILKACLLPGHRDDGSGRRPEPVDRVAASRRTDAAGPLVNEINRLLREVRAGKPRADALRDMAARLDFRRSTAWSARWCRAR